MSITKIILAVAVSVVSIFSVSAAGRPGLITLKTGDQIEAPEVWFTHGQAIYLMSSKDKKVVIEDPEIAYVQFYDEEKKEYGPKKYSEYIIYSRHFLKGNPKMPKKKKSGGYKVFDIDGYILYIQDYYTVDKYGFSSHYYKYFFKKPEWPWAVEIDQYVDSPLTSNKKIQKYMVDFYRKVFEDNSEMTKALNEKGAGLIRSYRENNDRHLYIPALLKDYVNTRDKK